MITKLTAYDIELTPTDKKQSYTFVSDLGHTYRLYRRKAGQWNLSIDIEKTAESDSARVTIAACPSKQKALATIANDVNARTLDPEYKTEAELKLV